MKRLEPDAREIYIAATISLPACPFCGAQPIVFCDQNETTGLVVGRVVCAGKGCHGNQHYVGHDRKEAQDGAIAAWSRRTTEPRP